MNTLLMALAIAAPPGVHLRIDGEGLMRFARGNDAVYSNDVVLVRTGGVLTTQDGYPILPQIHLPLSSAGFSVGMEGLVTVNGKTAGRIVLSTFGATRLEKTGKYFTSYAHGTIGYPGDGIYGVIRTTGSSAGGPGSLSRLKTANSDAPPTMEIALHSEVTGAEILMKDIALITGIDADQIGQVSLGAAPLYGSQRGLTRGYVIARLKNAGIDTDPMTINCPSGAAVSRKAQIVDPEALVKAAQEAVVSQLGSLGDLKLDRPVHEVLAPVGDIKLEAKQVVAAGDGATVYLEISVDGSVVSRKTITLVPTTPALFVHANDPLKIRMLRNGAAVEIDGKARVNGRVGSTISVESDSGVVFTGLLRTLNIVEVRI